MPKQSIDERFIIFHAQNPHVYEALVKLARIAKEAGCKRIGISLLFEKLRWDYLVSTDRGTERYKLNNVFRSRYARLIMKENPDLNGFITIRELKTA